MLRNKIPNSATKIGGLANHFGEPKFRHKNWRTRQSFWRAQIPNYKLKVKTFNILNFALLLCTLYFVLCTFSSAQEQFVYDDKGKRNPFIPLVTADGRILNLEQETESGVRIEGIVYDERGSCYAVVNQTIVKIGDWVGDCQVFKIEKNKVIFLKEGKPQEVELKKEEE